MAQFTQEEIQEELVRRGALPSKSFSQEEIKAELIRRGALPKENQPGMLEKAYTGLGDVAAGTQFGALEGLANIAPSIMNAPADIAGYITGKEYPHVPYASMSEFIPSGSAARGGQIVGNIIGAGAGIAPIAAGIGKGMQALKSASNLAPELGYLGRALQGALTGTLVEPERLRGALGGAAAGVATRGLEKFTSGSPEKIAKSFESKVNEVKGKSDMLYNRIFNKMNERGISNSPIRKPSINMADLQKSSPKRFTHSLNKFLENPTIENAHRAQSDMGKLESWFRKKPSLTASEFDAMTAALNAQKKIRGSVFQDLMKSGNTDLALDFSNATKNYATEVIPYLKNKNISNLLNKKLKPENFVKKILRDDEFLLSKSHEHPELMNYAQYRNTKDMIKKLLGTGVKGAGLGLGAKAVGGSLLEGEE